MIINMDERRAYHIRNYLLTSVNDVIKKDGILAGPVIALTATELVIQMWVGIFQNAKAENPESLARLDIVRQSIVARLDAARQVVASANPILAATALGLMKETGNERTDAGQAAGSGAPVASGAEGDGAVGGDPAANGAGPADGRDAHQGAGGGAGAPAFGPQPRGPRSFLSD